ncbi:hypothetical protein [Chimaeribacter arupi]|uniref:Protein phosphatase 2C domain-containing protein n=1 Tax=Chimaeribacter arupi TaxID=2060066 RepID=A0A2N5ERZ4_9GAMM|nr:hypothetical protein [Chimaeribacter arupi]PLR52621.1 hypothetical protein CYR34_03700 [Chimaeribacter arupi]
MKQEFSGTVPKDPECPEANEDTFAFSKDGRRLTLCDGASESFNSKLWADLLARKFITDPKVSPEWVTSVLVEYTAAHDFQSMSWSKQAAYERGSFATLVGVEQFEEHRTVEILAIGDSLTMLVDGGKLICAWPFDDPEKFKERPTLLSTLPGHNKFVGDSNFWTRHGKTFYLEGLAQPRLLCMTDALGEWALKQALAEDAGFIELLSLQTEEQLAELVLKERAAKRMRIDDSTLLVLSF